MNLTEFRRRSSLSRRDRRRFLFASLRTMLPSLMRDNRTTRLHEIGPPATGMYVFPQIAFRLRFFRWSKESTQCVHGCAGHLPSAGKIRPRRRHDICVFPFVCFFQKKHFFLCLDFSHFFVSVCVDFFSFFHVLIFLIFCFCVC